MKRFIFLTSLFVFVFATSPVLAATTTAATPTPNQKLDQQINQLKDKIASRVSELNLVEKRGIIGTVLEVKSNQITVTDSNGDARLIDVDEISKFSSTSNKSSFGISDLTKGTRVSILGLYNKESKRILARFIDTQVVPTRYDGVIATTDAKNLRFTVATDDKKQVNIDIETTSKINSYTNGAGLVKYGFSKLAVGDRVSIVGYPDKKDPTMLVADRVIDFLGVPKDPSIVVSIPTPTPSAVPTSAGAKSIKPIK